MAPDETPALDGDTALARRVATQRLVGEPLPSAAAVVELLACVQAQEWAHAVWSVGMRSAGTTHDQILAAFDAGDLLRTHVLRPTWHLVAPADLGWILAATADRPAIRRRAVLALAPFLAPDHPRAGEVGAALARALTDRDWQVRQAAEDLTALDEP